MQGYVFQFVRQKWRTLKYVRHVRHFGALFEGLFFAADLGLIYYAFGGEGHGIKNSSKKTNVRIGFYVQKFISMTILSAIGQHVIFY